MTRERPYLLIAGIALVLLVSTVLLGISIPNIALGLVILAAVAGTIIRPEIGLHVLVINAVVGLTHIMEMPRVGPLSVPILLEALVLGGILFQAAFHRRPVPIGSRVHLLMGLLAVWILLSVLTGVSVGPENFSAYRNLFLIRVVMFVLVSALITTPAQVKRLLITLLLSNIGLLVTAHLVRAGYFGEERITVSQNLERTGALVQNPNELAFTLTTMLVLAIILAVHVRRAIARMGLLVLAAANLFFIMATLSRSGFISLCVVLLFLLFKLTRNMRAVAVMVLLVLLGWLMTPDDLFTRFAHIGEVKDVDRLRFVLIGTAMTLDHPLLGVGLGNYLDLFWEYNIAEMRRAAPAHNMYLDISSQMGIPALLMYLAAFGIAWRGLRRMERELRAEGRTRSLTYLLGIGVQAFFINLAVFGLSGAVEFDYSAFIMLALALQLMREHRHREPVGASGRN